MKGFILGVLLAVSPSFAAEPPATTAAPPATTAPLPVDALRDQLKAAYQRGDVDGMLRYLHPQVVIIFPDGEILRGREALANYYNQMLKVPGHIVQSYSSDPIVTERAVHGDTVVSFGKMNDNYVLTDGTKFGLDSRFTVTCLRLPDGPAETGGWMIRSFHSSTDAFDNAVLGIAIRKVTWWAGVIGIVVGMAIGAILGLLVRKKRAAAKA